MSDTGWTVDTLREYLLRIAADQDKAVQAALAAAEKAVSKAEDASGKRFESVNEFRSQLADQTSTFIPRDTFDATVQGLNEKIERAVTTQRATMITLVGLAVTTGVSITIALLR